MKRPRLRAFVEPLPVRLEGVEEQVYVLRDPFKLAPERQVALPLAGVALISLMDGSRTPQELADEFQRRHGFRPELEQVRALVQALDEALLLEGPALGAALEIFGREPVRPPACIGSYPGEPEQLRAFLEEQWTRAGGPGGPPAASPRGAVRGIVSPHIDMHRGGHAYAHAWRAVAESCPAELFVVFGTSHTGTAPLQGGGAGPGPRFALTRKDFATPLGTVPTDRELVEKLARAHRGEDDLFAGEPHHKGEHSIEFQAVWLAHLFLGRRPVRILPVLCGNLQDVPRASRDEALRAFHGALAEVLAPYRREQVAFVAGIDLAHVGAQFHAPPVNLPALQGVEAQDRATLDLVLSARDADLVHEDIARDGDPRSICGHAPLVSLCLALQGEPLRGELLHYDRWFDGESAVSFASGVLALPAQP